jgi:hypothetical protein
VIWTAPGGSGQYAVGGTNFEANIEGRMSDNFTEVTTTSWGSRVGSSLTGMLFGIILIPVSVILLYWNEGRAVEASRALDQGATQVVEVSPDAVDTASDGKLVHLSGVVGTKDPARDPVFGITGAGLLRLERKVEMYQWKETKTDTTHESVGGSKTTETTYSYTKTWSDGPINSGSFRQSGLHQNPPMPVRSARFESDAAMLGAFHVEPSILREVSAFSPFRPESVDLSGGYHVEGDGFYRGQNPTLPEIGDVRVSFEAVPAQTLSIVAAQLSGRLSPYHAANGYEIALAKPGVMSAQNLFAEKRQEENILTWMLRGVGFVTMLIAFVVIARPLSMIFAFLPFLEGIVETGAFLIAVTFAVPLTLLTIAIAWIAHRPVMGSGLIASAVAALVLLRRMHRGPAPKFVSAAPVEAPAASVTPPSSRGQQPPFWQS